MSITIDGLEVKQITVDGAVVAEVTIDGAVAWAGYPKIVDDFEWGDLNSYTIFPVDGKVEIADTMVYEGNYALWVSDNYRLFSLNGLPNYPVRGNAFSCMFRGGGGVVCFGVQNETGASSYVGYSVNGSHGPVRDFYLSICKDGSTLANTDIPSGGGYATWHKVEVLWHSDGTIVASVYDASDGRLIAQASTVDVDYSDGGVGFYGRAWDKHYGAQGVYYDYYVIEGEL